MSTVNDTDLLLVERNGTQYQITFDEMSTLNDDDLLLVERDGVQYKIEAQHVSTGPNGLIMPPVEVLTPVNGAGLNEGDSYTPLSSAYVSTDTTPIYQRHFPELITTVSGGSWVDENKMFNGSQSYFSELTGAAGVVSQAVFTPQSGWTEAQTTVWAYATNGGTVEVLDDTDTVLRSYDLLTYFQEAGNDIGIVRADQKIRFSTNNQNESLFISRISGAPTDYVISGRVAFEFTDDTDLDKMVAPIIMTDENGDVKVPTTATVDSTTTIPGDEKSWAYNYVGNGATKTINYPNNGFTPTGQRMLWLKNDDFFGGVIGSNNLNGQYLTTNTSASAGGNSTSIQFNDDSTVLGVYSNFNANGTHTYGVEIGAAPKVLDIVKYTGNSAALREIPHNLGCKPGMIIIKRIDNTGNWFVWHKDLPPNESLFLNSTQSQGNFGMNNSAPTADVFYVTSASDINYSGSSYVAYVFAAETAGKVYCGTYTGNGSGSGQNINIVGAPAGGFLLIKRMNSAGDWIATTAQTASNQKYWYPNDNDKLQGSSTNHVGFLSSNGFYVLGTDYRFNNGGSTYAYLYVARDLTGPNSTQLNLLGNQDLEYFTDGTEITSNLAASGSRISFGSETFGGNNDSLLAINPTVGGQTFMDIRPETTNKWLIWAKCYTAAYSHNWFDSERHPLQFFRSATTYAQGYNTQGIMEPNGSSGYIVGNRNELNDIGESYVYWNFLNAPQFFDIQKYIGTGASGNKILHDIGGRAGCVIFRDISNHDHWFIYHSSLPDGQLVYMNLNNAAANLFPGWLVNAEDGFTLNANNTEINYDGRDYIAYIFAEDTPYVKCGKYTPTGHQTYVNVGFKPRWVMCKKVTGSGDWFILDESLIGPMKHLKANRDDAAGTNLSFSFNSGGFEVVDQGGSGVSDSGHDYIYIAIADESEGHPPNFPSSSTVQGTPDVNAATMVVNAESFDVGDSASAAPLEASITAVAGSDGNTLLVDSSTGTWLPGLYAKGSETTVSAPSADEVTFTSMNAGTTPFSGVDATLSSRTWTLESGPSATGPWTVVDTYVDYDALNSQDGATPWSSNKPALTADTFYRVKVQYDSTNAESVESVYSTFKTGAS